MRSRCLHWAGFVSVIAMLSASGSGSVADAQDVALAGRGPRFLVAANPKSKPAPLDLRSAPALRKQIALRLDNATLPGALAAVTDASGLTFVYGVDLLPPGVRVTVRADAMTVAAALTQVLIDTELDVLLLPSTQQIALIRRSSERLRQSGTLVGRVTDGKTGLPIVGAEVYLSGTSWRTSADTTGWYRLAAVDTGTYSLEVRRLGYVKQRRTVTVRPNQQDTVNIALEPRAVPLDELVTTATGQQRRRDLGNAITTIQADSVLRSAPIRSLTDLLANRVPGMSLQHTSGAPGDPARIRLRGIGSALRSNDPVVVVDGVRIYAAQSEARSGNLTNLALDPYLNRGRLTPAPSPLDQIDPNTIEKIEVFKGPSAATLYGADAANGVIVITTKRGKPGPTRWAARLERGRTTPAGHYPDAYFRWGHPMFENIPRFCQLSERDCVQDSLVRYQALNDPAVTVLGRGERTAATLSASGGSQALTYSVTGSYAAETGLVKLPGVEIDRFRTQFNRAAPDWMRRPHQFTQWSVSSNVTARLGATADVTLLAKLTRSEQQRSSLENQLGALAGTYVDRVNDLYYPSSLYGYAANGTASYLAEYYRRTTASALTFTTGLTASWRPRSWLTTTGNAGIDVVPRDDQMWLPAGLVAATDSGALARGLGRALTGTVNAQATARLPLRHGFVFETSAGANLTSTTTGDVVTSATGLVPGTSTLSGATHIAANETRASASVFGWYLEPRLTGQRLSLSTGIRLDGGSTYGTRVSGLLGLPKLNGSWVISEEPWFPFQSLFNSVRLRGAFGQAQTQPGAADRLRLYAFSQGNPDVWLTALGNTQLRPERRTEFEGGVDADLLDSRLSLEVTAYRKQTVDALMPVQLPASVCSLSCSSVLTNVGDIRNTGVELTMSVTPLRAPLATWNVQLNYARTDNTFVRLGAGVIPNRQAGLVAGYPVGSRWAYPIVGFADANGDDVLQDNEVQTGDSLVYLGRLLPNQEASLHANLALFGGAVGVAAVVSYETGATQVNQGSSVAFYRGLFDSTASFAEQAAALGLTGPASIHTDYGMTQDISTLRFQSLSLTYRAPARLARLLRAQQLAIALQGSNLGLHSTYRGADPDVNGWSAGENIVDTGQLPLPRTWQLAVDLQF